MHTSSMYHRPHIAQMCVELRGKEGLQEPEVRAGNIKVHPTREYFIPSRSSQHFWKLVLQE